MLESIAALLKEFEQSGLGQAARTTGWVYPIVNLAHVLGAALLLGAIATFDIQVLRRAQNLNVVANAVVPVASTGLLLQVISGVVLLSADASSVAANPAFQFKMGMFVLGLVNIALFRWRFGGALRIEKPLAGAYGFALVSLASWTLVLLAGRAIAYL
jgi:hypothetical protein